MPARDESQRVEGFYEAALTEAERMRLPSARDVEGFDEELALLRTRLFTAAQVWPERVDLLMKSVGALVRVAAVRYRMSAQSQDDLAESLAGVINSIGAAVGLGDFGESTEW